VQCSAVQSRVLYNSVRAWMMDDACRTDHECFRTAKSAGAYDRGSSTILRIGHTGYSHHRLAANAAKVIVA